MVLDAANGLLYVSSQDLPPRIAGWSVSNIAQGPVTAVLTATYSAGFAFAASTLACAVLFGTAPDGYTALVARMSFASPAARSYATLPRQSTAGLAGALNAAGDVAFLGVASSAVVAAVNLSDTSRMSAAAAPTTAGSVFSLYVSRAGGSVATPRCELNVLHCRWAKRLP
jgi:hypothetical protein